MANFDSYVICTSPRSGSTLLCQLLAATGVAGDRDDIWIARRIADRALGRGGGDQQRPGLGRAPAGRAQDLPIGLQAEAHVDDPRAPLHQPVEAGRDQRRRRLEALAEDLGLEQHGVRCGGADQARDGRTVTQAILDRGFSD